MLFLLPAALARFGCSGHGDCLGGVCIDGLCACDEAFSGERCEHRSCAWMAANRPCANGGSCTNGTCTCPHGVGGEFCELNVCDAGRSGHGTCGISECHPGFTGDLCNEVVKAHCPFSCSGHGLCGQDGRCRCDAGFAGASCARVVPNACMHNCGGHGRCQADGRCECDVGFAGADCSTASQLSVCPSGCSARGLCGPDGSCICEPGFSGEACGRADDEVAPPEGAEGGAEKAAEEEAVSLLEVGSSVEAGEVSQPSAEADGGGGGGVWSGFDHGEAAARAKAQAGKDFAARAAADAQAVERAAMDAEAQAEAQVGAEVAGGRMARVTGTLPHGVVLLSNSSRGGSGGGRNDNSSDSSHDRTGVPPLAANPARLPADRPRTSRDPRRYAPVRAACPAQCSGHGQCRRGACRCHPGYGGASCAEVRPTCEANCSGHGGCNELRGECACHGGFAGAACTIAVEGACPFGCSAHGACSPSFANGCRCTDGMAPPTCAVAAAVGASAAFVQQLELATRLGDGKWAGLRGERDVPGACPLGCSGKGLCAGSECRCASGFTGSGCELATPRCPADCNGHGYCNGGTCVCVAGWGGAECDVPAYTCNGGCSGHGRCVAPPGGGGGGGNGGGNGGGSALLGACSCTAGWGGARCQVSEVPAPHCEGNCSGHGMCAGAGACVCERGWEGAACELKEEAAAADCPTDCCGHGSCRLAPLDARRSIAGSTAAPRRMRQCVCHDRWRGADCCESALSEACPANCNGQGACEHGTCRCEAGWGGEACDSVVVVATCPNHCNGHGACERARCVCHHGFSGEACEEGDAFGLEASGVTASLARHLARVSDLRELRFQG
eukprot:scaffold22148_cov64-Phaeocystis_antarctica.AAC.5